MTRREIGRLSALWLSSIAACHPSGAQSPWGVAERAAVAEHADVQTVSPDYRRTRSHVLVRKVDRPTRAALDYAAYHANFMIAAPAPEQPEQARSPLDTAQPFDGLIDKATLTADIAKTPLSAAERRQPLAFAPLVEVLLASKIEGAEQLEELGSAVRSESWGQRVVPGVALQSIAEAFVHEAAAGPELWVKIEIEPWVTSLGALPDQDGDGFPEVYGRARADRMNAASLDFVEREYAGRVLTTAEVKAWANQLSSYWYPSFNTDLVPAGAQWPDDGTEPDIKAELAGHSFAAPTIVLRGKPERQTTYAAFLVKGFADVGGASSEPAAPSVALELAKTRATPDVHTLADAIAKELAAEGGTFEAWAAKLATVHSALERRLASTPKKVKALAGSNGFLFFRNSVDFVLGGDLEQQRPGKNPLPSILAFKEQLEALGVDFLFVPVPTKVEIFPDALDPKLAPLVGKVINPYARKLALSLAQRGVEVVDLLSPMLAARAAGDKAEQEPLYQPQDTHWTDRGLRLAADVLAARIKRYPWYAQLARHAQSFGTREASFTRVGDLQSRLPEALKKKYRPQTLVAQQVLRADGTPYEDDPESPIVVLGDSFTGVYELTDAEHAGLSAHLARGISYPVDLVMSYGGGPNVRNKLMRIGLPALAKKKLVIWVMASRDLYNYAEDWEPLKVQ